MNSLVWLRATACESDTTLSVSSDIARKISVSFEEAPMRVLIIAFTDSAREVACVPELKIGGAYAVAHFSLI